MVTVVEWEVGDVGGCLRERERDIELGGIQFLVQNHTTLKLCISMPKKRIVCNSKKCTKFVYLWVSNPIILVVGTF